MRKSYNISQTEYHIHVHPISQ